jgi:hypothetical protein
LATSLPARSLKVGFPEVWADGRLGFADGEHEVGGTRLGVAPVPALAEIAAGPEFEPCEVTQAEFEERWSGRWSTTAPA